ncbi:MAG: lantibiotic dehydratase family protein [Actinomycetota bacterium]|nr:lantibiotic dehydratase family protein [Actinomycetota bacterium]
MIPVMLRVAGLPISVWTSSGNERLFAQLRELDGLAGQYRLQAAALAETLGHRVVPRPDLQPADRAAVLRIRRSLHGAGELPPTELAHTVELLDRLALAGDLGAALRGLRRDRQRLSAGEAALAIAVEAEPGRLAELAWSLVLDSPIAQQAIRDANPQAFDDIVRRLAAGEPWNSKRLRQRADYLWRLISRGSTRATPRGWFGHIALLDPALPPPSGLDSVWAELSAEVAVEWSDNIHDRSLAGATIQPDALLTLAALHWDEGEHVQFWVRRAEDASRLYDVRLRDTAALRAVRRRLDRGALSLRELGQQLAPAADDVLAGFVQYLAGIGVIEVSTVPAREIGSWQPVTAADPPGQPAGFLDVYRRSTGGLSPELLTGYGTLIERALRVLSVIEDDGTVPPADDLIGEQPRPLLELVAEQLDRQASDTENRPHPHDWLDARVASAGTGYGRLVAWLDGEFDKGVPIDLDRAPMVLGTEPPRPHWPVDCLLRPIGSGSPALAILDRIEPAGVLDSRFGEALDELDPAGCKRTDWYRDFLAAAEKTAGARFVEVLIPPLAVRAANAVRRPGYTTLWTGDPNLAHYIAGRRRPTGYLPLAEITLRRQDGRVQAEAAGKLIWPVYHATRSAAQPWDVVSALLLRASPRPRRARWRALGWTLPGWPERDHLPRLTVGGGALVLAAEQWRLPLDREWAMETSTFGKCRLLNRWRAELGLPRWISVVAEVHEDPVPCDLASVQTVALWDRYARQGSTELLAAELLPDPEQLGAADLAHGPHQRSAAELLMRLPVQPDVEVLAGRVAEVWRNRRKPALVARIS